MNFTIEIERESEVELWRQIFDQISDAILIRKVLPPSTRLDSERDLAALLGLSRSTVKRAYVELARQGLIDRRGGVTRIPKRPRPPASPDPGRAWDPEIPDPFRRFPLQRWLNAEEIVQAVALLWDTWPNCSWPYRELKYVLQHYDGDFDGDIKTLSAP
jgi:DNA-binding transcriptional MocR family regulator